MEDVIKEDTKVHWLDEEIKNMPQPNGDFERLPSVQFAENQITRMEIDATEQFRKWDDQENNKTKVIIPCMATIEGKKQKANWWLNIKNPVYKDVIHRCKAAEDKSKVSVGIIQTGSKQATKYNLVKD